MQRSIEGTLPPPAPQRRAGPTTRVRRAIRVLGVVWLVLLVGFALYYTLDQRSLHRPPQETVLAQQIEKAEEAVRTNPDDAIARIAVADLYLQAGRYQAAVEQYQEALRLSPSNLPAANGLASAYLHLGQGEKAVPLLQEAIERNQGRKVLQTSDDMAEAHLRLGRIYLTQGKADEARAEAAEAQKIAPADADVLLLLGQAQAKGGDLQGAVEQYRKALRFVPKFPEAYQALAEAYDGLEDRSRAAYARAMAVYSRGDYSQAAKDLKGLVRAQPELAEARLGLGMAYERLGKADGAAEEYREALRLDPQLDYARTRLGALGER